MFGVHISVAEIDKAVERVLDSDRIEKVADRVADKLADKVVGHVLDRLAAGLKALDQEG